MATTERKWQIEKGIVMMRLRTMKEYEKYLADVSEAKAACEAYEKDPDHSPKELKKKLLNLVDTLVTCFAKPTHFDDARSALEKVMKIDPDDYEAMAKFGAVIFYLIDGGADIYREENMKRCKLALEHFNTVKKEAFETYRKGRAFGDMHEALKYIVYHENMGLRSSEGGGGGGGPGEPTELNLGSQYPQEDDMDSESMTIESLVHACKAAEQEYNKDPNNADKRGKYGYALRKLSESALEKMAWIAKA